MQSNKVYSQPKADLSKQSNRKNGDKETKADGTVTKDCNKVALGGNNLKATQKQYILKI